MRYYNFLGKQTRNGQVEFILREAGQSIFTIDNVIAVSRDDVIRALAREEIEIDRYRLNETKDKIIQDKRMNFEVQETLYKVFAKLVEKYSNRIALTEYEVYTKDRLYRNSLKAACSADIESANELVRYYVEFTNRKTFKVGGLGTNGLSQNFNTIDAVYNALECDIITKFINNKSKGVSDDKIGYNIGKLSSHIFEYYNNIGRYCHTSNLYPDSEEEKELGFKYGLEINVQDAKGAYKSLLVKANSKGVYSLESQDPKDKKINSFKTEYISDVWKAVLKYFG